MTSKHHEGYCLWNNADAERTWQRHWNAVTGTPKRDLLGDLTNAVRDAGLKMGYYYSLYEWFNPLLQQKAKTCIAYFRFTVQNFAFVILNLQQEQWRVY